MTDQEREAREWTLITKRADCPPIHSDLAAVAPGSDALIRGGEVVRVLEAEPVEEELCIARFDLSEAQQLIIDLDAALAGCEEAEGTHELLAHFRDERKRLSEALRKIAGDFEFNAENLAAQGMAECATDALRGTEQEPNGSSN